jgi:mRNA-degrading endonuclease RelE of RelBE toxin-antitoxin system
MKKYNVYISKEARGDLKDLADYIADILKAPLTSERYTNGLINELISLSNHAESISLSNRKSILKYGTTPEG